VSVKNYLLVYVSVIDC